MSLGLSPERFLKVFLAFCERLAQTVRSLKDEIKKYLSRIGRKGGQAGSIESKSKAAKAKWAKWRKQQRKQHDRIFKDK